jgi:hypothetical protein
VLPEFGVEGARPAAPELQAADRQAAHPPEEADPARHPRLASEVRIEDRYRRVMMRKPGGDAMDAVIAADGAWRAVLSADQRAFARHPRYRHEGRLYA